MLETAIHEEAEAALNRLRDKHSDLKEKLGKAYGYAVFPSVGRAGVVIGGAYGQGEVYEHGEPIGFATMGQITVGIQVGGQTFTEVVIFNKKESLDSFKHRGKLGFSANASAVIVKAAATATSGSAGLEAKAYSLGGMLLELSLGGTNFLFVPPLVKSDGKTDFAGFTEAFKDETKAQEQKKQKDKKEKNKSENKEQSQEQSQEQQVNANGETQENGHSSDNPYKGAFDRIRQLPSFGNFLGSTALKLAHQVTKKDEGGNIFQKITKSSLFKKDGKGSIFKKVGNIVSGIEKEQSLSRVLHQDVKGTLKMIEENNPGFKKNLDNAYAYAVFPSVGRASLVLGGCYGKGEVFEQGKLSGYAGIVQFTIGVQVGGETITEIIVFHDKAGFDRFKQSRLSFAANASAVIMKAGAGVTNSYQSGRVYTFSEGGLLIEAVIGLQKCIYRQAALTRGKSIEDDKGVKKAA